MVVRTCVRASWGYRALQCAAGATVVAAVAVVADMQAQAACTPTTTAGPPALPAPGTTVTCSGNTTDQNAFGVGYGTAHQTGITIDVGAGASVIGSDTGILITDATIRNGAGATIQGALNGIDAVFGFVTVTNDGTIAALSTSGASTGIGIRARDNAAVINHVGGVVSGATSAVRSIAGAVTLDNAGRITGLSDVAVMAVTAATVTNRAGGTIGGSSGIVATGGSVLVQNAGRITGTATEAVSAIDKVTLINTATGTLASADIAVSGAVINVTNSGSVTGAVQGILARDVATVVNLAGGSITGGSTGGVYAGGGSSIFNAGFIGGGTNAIAFAAGGNTVTLAPGSVISGNVLGFGSDTLQLGGTGSANFDVSQIGASAQYRGFGTFNKIDSSLWSLTGTAGYAGPVNVNGGTLAVNGNLASASLLTVNAGGTLGGTGVLGAAAIHGGTLAPGNSIGTLIMSSLTMTAASTYLVEVSGTSSDRTVVTGAATLAGQVSISPLTRLTATTTYTILNAGALSGTFDSASVTGNFARNARLAHVGNEVLLTLDAGLLAPALSGAATINQKNVAAGIDKALVSGAALPASFNALFALSGNDLLNGLTQVSGETATGAQQTTFDAMTQFMGVISDPFTAGRSGGVSYASSFAAADDARAYASQDRQRTGAERDAFAMFTKAPLRGYEARWNVWAAGFGGSRTTDGNTVLGSNRTTGNVAAAAVGADYWFSPATVAGFALAGGGTSFSVAGGGSGRSDLFQAGAFIRHNIASSYIRATAAYGWQDISTDRLVTGAGTDRLRVSFSANAYSGRIEGGNRWLLPQFGDIGLTPYAAVQVTAFDLPAYAETSINGAGGLALNYAARTVTATRTELGLRSDKTYAVGDALLTLRGRAAWAHDYNSDRNVAATFQSLPGSSFVVNGASAARNAALTSASAEMSFTSGLSLAAIFDGEFSDTTRSYAGKGVVRYAW